MDKSAKTPSTNPNPAATAEERVPAEWPGAFGAYQYSKRAVKRNLGVIIVFLLLTIAVGGLGNFIRHQYAASPVSLVLGTLVTGGYITALLASVRGKVVDFEDAFKRGFSLWLKMIGLVLLLYVILALSLVLLIVPFFFVMPRLVLAPYFLVDKKMGVIEALQASWDATKGHSMKVWGIVGVTILLGLLMITIIGIPFAIYLGVMYSAVNAVLYEHIRRLAPAKNPEA